MQASNSLSAESAVERAMYNEVLMRIQKNVVERTLPLA